MCGVAAIFAYHYAAPEAKPEELRTIRDAMISRGPDAAGEWFSSDFKVALGTRRLAIIDLSPKANQPMASPDGSVVISFNGEIYNYRELQDALKKRGRVFASGSDTEVLLQLYEEKGEDMLSLVRGMFAFVIWDGRKKKLWMARDPYGIKPLYYANDGWTIRIASQVQALLQSSAVSKEKSAPGAAGFFLSGTVPEPYTLFEDIQALPAGHSMTVDALGLSAPKPYFSIAKVFKEAETTGQSLSQAEWIEYLREALRDTLRHHLVADVPISIFLSGGIDSGVLAGLARDLAVSQLMAITLAFDEFAGTEQDETRLSQSTADRYGIEHRVRVLTRNEFESGLDGFLQAMDQPSIDGINTYFISKAAKEYGFKVALSGLGADELFGGYPSFVDIPRWVKALGWTKALPGFGRLAGSVLRLFAGVLPPKATGLMEFGACYEKAYFLRRALFMPRELASLMGEEMACEGLKRLGYIKKIKSEALSDIRSAYGAVASMEASFYMRNQLLKDADWASMAHSVEVRVPYVDTVLLKRLAPFLVAAQKNSFKEFLAQVPGTPLASEIAQKKKTGFVVPVDRWISADRHWDEWKKVPVLNGKTCHWSRRWAYLVFQRQVKK